MPLDGMRIAVIGAGIGGLAAARALALRGAEVTVLEQAEKIREVGAGLQISPNGAAVLRGLGIEPATIGMRNEAVHLLDRSGRTAIRMGLDDSGYYLCHRADLIAALAHGARQAGARIRLLQRVETIETGAAPDSGPEIRIANQARMRPDLVVGADGLHSRLRGGDPGPGRAEVHRPGGLARGGALGPRRSRGGRGAAVHGAGRHLVTYPLRGGAYRNIVAVEERR
ncbi:FAD-dependent oxidoreductase, partial [Oceanicola sp. S124]|uniref:FAD-dependent oxidoreductase n=1 Tax=Oceanicola sp. S124 TaxID=1042378 RepID=UPI00025589DD